jgi:hypothetical protein
MVYPAAPMLLLAYAHLGKLGGARVLTRAVLIVHKKTPPGNRIPGVLFMPQLVRPQVGDETVLGNNTDIIRAYLAEAALSIDAAVGSNTSTDVVAANTCSTITV